MFSQTITKKLSLVSKELYAQFYSLNYRSKMGLRPTLVEFRNHDNPKKFHYHQGKNKKEPYVHFILDEKEKVVAWALSFDYYGNPWCYFYVRRKYRRKGLGTRLLKRAARHTWELYEKKMCVGPHDKGSNGFFSILKEKVEETGEPWGIEIRHIWEED